MKFKQTIKDLKKWLTIWVWIALSVWIIGVSYAAFTTITTVNPWDTLTDTKWNEVVDRLNAIEKEQLATAWVNFDWSSCSWWIWNNECTINDFYNITKVIRNNTWDYTVDFNQMDNWNYAIWGFSIWYSWTNVTWASIVTLFPSSAASYTPFQKDQNWVRISVWNPNNWIPFDSKNISLQIYWGKN